MSIYIDKRLCKGCNICVALCPRSVFSMSTDVNQKGYNYAVAENPELCISCKQCEYYCPDLAIFIEK